MLQFLKRFWSTYYKAVAEHLDFKMPVNKHALIRYHALDKCFRNIGRRFNMKALMAACNEALYNFTGEKKYGDPDLPGISRRQIYDDITFMESTEGFGAVIERDKVGRDVYYRYEDPNFTINNQPITDDEMAQLRETTLMLSRFKGMPQFEWIDSLITSLEDKFNLKKAERSVVGLDNNYYARGKNWISQIFNHIITKTPVRVEYQTFHNGDRVWTIHPYFLKQYNNRWYLIGLNDNEYKSISHIALDRINSINPTDVPYIENTAIEDIDEYFGDIVGVSIPPERKIERVVLKFSEHRFPYVEAKPIHESQCISKEDRLEQLVRLKLMLNKELESIILSFGDDVEVIEPLELREAIANKIKNSYKKYFPVQ